MVDRFYPHSSYINEILPILKDLCDEELHNHVIKWIKIKYYN